MQKLGQTYSSQTQLVGYLHQKLILIWGNQEQELRRTSSIAYDAPWRGHGG